MLTVLSPADGPVWAAAGAFVIGIGMGFVSTVFIVAIQASVPWRQRGGVEHLGTDVAGPHQGAVYVPQDQPAAHPPNVPAGGGGESHPGGRTSAVEALGCG